MPKKSIDLHVDGFSFTIPGHSWCRGDKYARFF